MPHLQFDINKKINNKQRKEFSEFVMKQFSYIMQTGLGHIAISIREVPKKSLSLGRVRSGENVCLMNLDIRSGRSKKQQRKLVRTLMEGVEFFFGIKLDNQYATYSLHSGNDFNLYEKSLNTWIKKDDPLG